MNENPAAKLVLTKANFLTNAASSSAIFKDVSIAAALNWIRSRIKFRLRPPWLSSYKVVHKPLAPSQMSRAGIQLAEKLHLALALPEQTQANNAAELLQLVSIYQ